MDLTKGEVKRFRVQPTEERPLSSDAEEGGVIAYYRVAIYLPSSFLLHQIIFLEVL